MTIQRKRVAFLALGAGIPLLTLFIAFPSARSQTAKPEVEPPARKADWKLTGEGGNIEKAGFSHAGKKPALAELKDSGSDNYILTGKVLLPQQDSSLLLTIGESAQAGKAPAGKGKQTDTSGLRLARNKKEPLLVNGKKYPQAEELGDLSKTPIAFTVMVLPEIMEIHVAVPGDRVSRAATPTDRRLVRLTLANCQVSDLRIQSLPRMPANLIPIPLDRLANLMLTGDKADKEVAPAFDPQALSREIVNLDGVSFIPIDSPEAQAVNVSRIVRSKQNVSKKEANLPFTGFDFQLPGDQYAAIHLLAFSSQREKTVPQVTVKVGYKHGGADIWVQQTTDVPLLTRDKANDGLSSLAVKLADGSQGQLHHVRVPLAYTGNMTEYASLGFEFVRLVETPMDGFHIRRIDPPSGVVILAATMERSIVDMKYTTAEYGNVFFDTQKAIFNVQLTNRSDKAVSGKAKARCNGPGTARERNPFAASWTVEADYSLEPGQSKTVPLDVTPKYRGTYSCAIGVETAGQVLQQRDTSFAFIAPDTRKAMADSPFGIWCFWNAHTTTQDPLRSEKLASLMNKGGWRWTYGGGPGKAGGDDPVEMFRHMKEKYKITWNCQYPPHAKHSSAKSGVKGAYYDKELFEKDVVPWLIQARKKGLDPSYIVLHESRINSALLRNFSEYFGGTPYAMPDDEKAKYDKQFEHAKAFCQAMKKADPEARIILFNDYPAFVNEHLKRGFPSEAFDVIGLESAMFHRQPERQPDWLCLLGTLHQIKRMQKQYGYDKPVWTTEALYHSTQPGKFDLHDQAVVAVREAMLALALGVERMAAANEVVDCSDDYAKSGWGNAGMCFRDPEYNPKPSFGMYSWLTQVLDQAKYSGKLRHDSTSLHVLDFKKADGAHVYPMWVVSGRQKVKLKLQDDKGTVYDSYGNKLPASAETSQLVLEVSDTPIYVTGTIVTEVVAHESIDPEPHGQVVVKVDDLEHAKLVEESSALLEKFGVPHPIKGQYKVSFEKIGLRIEQMKDNDQRGLIPRYGELQLAKPIELPARPFALDLHVKGNGGWGQIMLELVDAKGKVWTSCKSGPAETMGKPYVTFDGWNALRIYLPGQFASEKAKPWPANVEWDGEGEVVYPLKLNKIIVTMRPSILYVDEERTLTDKAIHIDRIEAIQPPAGQ